MDSFITEGNGKFYATAQAYIVDGDNPPPRELASEWGGAKTNDSFLWIAGRYVQANAKNKNGHFWAVEDIESGESTIRHTPLNVLHRWDRPVGTFVETKIVHREAAAEDMLPEIQALAVLWGANFPNVAKAARDAHEAEQLWFSMECVAEKKQCLECNEVFPFRAEAHETCKHLAVAGAPRRFINPTFLGGALIFPPEKPAWSDADVTEVAHELTSQYANRDSERDVLSSGEWQRLMDIAMSS
jgi:hypothetical protein